MRRDPASGTLYLGNPALAYQCVEASDTAWNAAEVQRSYTGSAAAGEIAMVDRLHATHAITTPSKFSFTPDHGWKTALSHDLVGDQALRLFQIQGKLDAPIPTDEGLLVRTAPEAPRHVFEGLDHHAHVYLWSTCRFEGDLYVRYRFKPLTPGGLSLLMVQCAGMQGEDFMEDYPRRTEGSMKTVCWSNVRNYHWEYHRQMTDTRNDGQSHALLKNPVLRPLDYRHLMDPHTVGEWHVLEFVQEGGRLRGAIDGVGIFDVHDDPQATGAPIYTAGRIAIRCMTRTQMLFRDLVVMNRLSDYEVEPETAPLPRS